MCFTCIVVFPPPFLVYVLLLLVYNLQMFRHFIIFNVFVFSDCAIVPCIYSLFVGSLFFGCLPECRPTFVSKKKKQNKQKKPKNKHILLFSSIYQSSEPHLWLCLSVLFLAPYPADPYAVNMIMWMWRANGNEASFKNSHVKHVKCSCPRVKTLNVPYLF